MSRGCSGTGLIDRSHAFVQFAQRRKPVSTNLWYLCFAILLGLIGNPVFGEFLAGDAVWNYRSNGDDRFNDNDPYVRPWRSGMPTAPWPAATEDGSGRWVGRYSYEFGWGNVNEMNWSFGQNGSF